MLNALVKEAARYAEETAGPPAAAGVPKSNLQKHERWEAMPAGKLKMEQRKCLERSTKCAKHRLRYKTPISVYGYQTRTGYKIA